MKTRHIKQLFLSCGMAACLGLASCEDFLIREPKDRSDVGTFFTTQNNAIIAVNGIYNGVLDGAASLMLTGETAAGKYPVQAMECLVKTARSALQDLEREREEA